METSKQYIYSFPNVSSTLRVVELLRQKYQSYLYSVVVINSIDHWLIELKLSSFIPPQITRNIQAFLEEMGVAFQPSVKILNALASLEQGESPTAVMNRYRVVIVAYGQPATATEEIENFRDQIVERLGYCPQNMV